MKTPASPRSTVDIVSRFLSMASLAGTALTMVIYYVSLNDRGVEFATVFLSYYMLVAQVWILTSGVFLACVIAAFLREFRLGWETVIWFVLALAGLGMQYYWLSQMKVDPQSIP